MSASLEIRSYTTRPLANTVGSRGVITGLDTLGRTADRGAPQECFELRAGAVEERLPVGEPGDSANDGLSIRDWLRRADCEVLVEIRDENLTRECADTASVREELPSR